MKKNLFHVFALSYRYDGRQGDYGGFIIPIQDITE